MKIVKRRDAATLLPIISQHVFASTTVHSDEWRAYNRVNTLLLVAAHRTVNHSVNFVDPGTGVHTQHIESYRNRVRKTDKMKGCHRHMLLSYSDEFMWGSVMAYFTRQPLPPSRWISASGIEYPS